MMMSVVIPTLNEEKTIERILRRLKPQLSKDDDIIIVDSQSQDRTVSIARKYTKQIYITPREGIGKARTFGATKSKQRYVVFFDADTLPAPDWIKIAKDHVKNGASGIAGLGLYETRSNKRYLYDMFSRFVFFAAKWGYVIHKIPYLIGNNMMIDRKLFLKYGGFRSVVCEDFDLGRRLPTTGYKYAFDKNMRVFYSTRKFEQHGFVGTLFEWGSAVWAIKAGQGFNSKDYAKWRLAVTK